MPTKETTLGRWVSNQRKHYQQFLADPDRGAGGRAELRRRFERLAGAGFHFYVGKGNAQPGKALPT